MGSTLAHCWDRIKAGEKINHDNLVLLAIAGPERPVIQGGKKKEPHALYSWRAIIVKLPRCNACLSYAK